MPRKLKVFRTNAGFYDAYIAAPSRLAALAAWGAKGDLFAREAAEEVTDPELMAEALARPGEVIQRPRGDFAAIEAKAMPLTSRSARPTAHRKRKPGRAALERAEAALARFEEDAATQMADLQEREAALVRERVMLQAKHQQTRDRLEQRKTSEEQRYRERLAQWEASKPASAQT